MKISIVIPTIDGREDHYARCLDAYQSRTSNAYEIIVERNWPSCGLAWQAGAARATGDFIHLTCDDIEPLNGWDTAATEALRKHVIPCPLVRDGRTGAPQSHGYEQPDWSPVYMTSLPFMPRQLWEHGVSPLFVAHYLIYR